MVGWGREETTHAAYNSSLHETQLQTDDDHNNDDDDDDQSDDKDETQLQTDDDNIDWNVEDDVCNPQSVIFHQV